MEIKCPHCNQVFDINEDMASHIKEQVRTKVFEKELADKVKLVRESAESDTRSKVAEAVMKEREKYEKKLADAKAEVADAKSELKTAQAQSDLEIQQVKLETKIEYSDRISDLEAEKRAIEHERDYYKDLKTKMSTKMVGETLEQHCEIEFNKIRMAAFPNAEFGKDNVVSKTSGSKGDYIFREYDGDVEIISIMFEMKNEMDTTATKKTNAHFFKELDKDRREKKCEYAVLVSMLEADNELYNQGIVDVSYEYEKMYVIRPQFFIPMISILRNAALNAVASRKELVRIQNQNIDVKNFEDAFLKFKDGFSYNYEQASKRFDEAIKEIDKSIDHLNAVKTSLLASSRQLRLANNKVDDITIKKLTANSPILRDEFERKAGHD
jgi:hypothetical protein